MMSYMPFKRNIQLQNVQNIIESRAYECMSPLRSVSPMKGGGAGLTGSR